MTALDVAVDTPNGRLKVWATSLDHLAIGTTVAGDDRNPEQIDTLEAIVVNGVEYRLRMDLHSLAWWREQEAKGRARGEVSGEWVLDVNTMYMVRNDNPLTEATDAARKKIVTLLFPWVAEWANGPVASALLADAETADRHDRIASLRVEIIDMRTALHDKEVALARLQGDNVVELLSLRDSLKEEM